MCDCPIDKEVVKLPEMDIAEVEDDFPETLDPLWEFVD